MQPAPLLVLASVLLFGGLRGLVAQAARPCRARVSDSATAAAAVVSATDPRTRVGPFAQLCDPSIVVAAAWMPARDDSSNYGPRLVVLHRRPRWTVTQIQNGMLDAALPGLFVFQVGRRVLLLADLGNEGSWGLGTFALRGDTLESLGILDVGVPASFNSDPDETAIDHASITLVAGRWRVSFDTVIVVRPNQSASERRVMVGQPPFVFEQAAGGWHALKR